MMRIIFLFLTFLLPINLFGKNLDIYHIKLSLQFDWNKKQAIGIAYITLSAVQKTNIIHLDAGKLDIKKVMLRNKELDFKYTDKEDDNLKIILPNQLDSKETITISIEYKTTHENRADPNALGGSFGKGLRFFEPTSTTPRKRKQIWSSGEPNGNKYWFPCKDDISDIHTTEIIATVEKPLSVFSNGKLIGVRDNKNKSRTFHYQTEMALPNYLITLVIGEYIDEPLKSGKTTIHNYGYPDEKEAVKSTVVLLPKMMKFLEEKTGYNYTFDDYSQIVVQDYPYPGMIGQHGLATLSDNYIDDHGVHEDYKYLWDGVAVQALSNQWF